MTSTVRLQGNQEQLLRYAGANIRRCLGKKGGKNEEAETYLTTVSVCTACMHSVATYPASVTSFNGQLPTGRPFTPLQHILCEQ